MTATGKEKEGGEDDVFESVFSFRKQCPKYVLVITLPRVFWRIYMHEPEGTKCPEGQVHIYQPEHKEGVL